MQKINGFLTDGRQHWIATVNPEIILKAREDEEYKKVLSEADLRVTDGVGIIWASRFLGEKLKERITGVDLVYDILRMTKLRVMVIGADEDSRQKARAKLKNIFPLIDLEISSVEIDINGKNRGLFLKLNEEIRNFRPAILFVAFGAPYQETWIYENLRLLSAVKLAIGVGGAIDIIAGKFPRAPRWMRKIGLEWLWRLYLEPKRWRRVFNAVIVFSGLIIKSKINNKFNKTDKSIRTNL